MRRVISLVLAFAFIAQYAAAPVSAAGSRPNPNANPRCPFGPGVARWSIKTSVPTNESPGDVATVNLKDLIGAPDLDAEPQTVEAVRRAFNGVSSQPNARFQAQLRWRPQPVSVKSVPHHFTLTLPPITQRLVAEANNIAQDVRRETGQPASIVYALISAELDAQRIPEPVTIGASSFHEGDVIATSGYVLASTCEGDDGDFHIDIAPSSGADICAVVEVPNPYYIRQAGVRAAVNRAESVAKQLAVGEYVTVTGQLFYDAAHGGSSAGGGRGVNHCAQSLWEIHPVFRVTSR